MTTQKVSIYDTGSADAAFNNTITISNPLPISLDYSLLATNPSTVTSIAAVPQVITYVDEHFDGSNSFNNGTGVFTFASPSETPIKFGSLITFRNLGSLTFFVVLRIVRERSGVRTLLAEETGIISTTSGDILLGTETTFQDFQTGDKVFARVSIGNFITLDLHLLLQ
jgi:hypothetical protein